MIDVVWQSTSVAMQQRWRLITFWGQNDQETWYYDDSWEFQTNEGVGVALGKSEWLHARMDEKKWDKTK